MSLKHLRRLLVHVDQETVFVSRNDTADPRLGDLVESTESIEEGGGIRCVIVGCPQHIGIERNNGRPGAAEGPTAIRRALYKLATSAILNAHRQGTCYVIADGGDIDTEGKTLEQIHDELHDVVENLLSQGFFPIVLGGGHDCVWPIISAYEEVGDPYGLINIDAHADVRPLKDDMKAHSGSPFRQMLDREASALVEGAFVEYGLQHAAVALSHLEYLREKSATVVMLDEVRATPDAWADALKKATAGKRFHITLDMDGFASAYAPGVSAPSANGLLPHEIAPHLKAAAQRSSLTSFDVVEVSPPHDTDGRTAKLAAEMIMEVLAGLASRQ